MSWSRTYPLRFSHCDPAGIAYYPRLLELCDNAIEEWTGDVIGVPRHVMEGEQRRGTPAVSLQIRFARPCRHGDQLRFGIETKRVGRSSLELAVGVTCEAQERFEADYTLALVDHKSARAIAWPPEWRARLEASL